MKQKVDFIRASNYPDRFRVFANVDWDGAGGPGGREGGCRPRAVDQERRDRPEDREGPRHVREEGRRHAPGGRRSRAEADWDLCARLNIPVIIHTAEPQEFFSPLDFQNERWLELALFTDRRHYMPGNRPSRNCTASATACSPPTRRPATSARTCQLRPRPAAAALLDRLPNVVLEVSAVLYDFGRQPRAAREFFINTRTGCSSARTPTAERVPDYWRVFETANEFFDYYRDYHAFWKLYGMGLPDEVLKKLYYKNALRVTPGLPQAGWPK